MSDEKNLASGVGIRRFLVRSPGYLDHDLRDLPRVYRGSRAVPFLATGGVCACGLPAGAVVLNRAVDRFGDRGDLLDPLFAPLQGQALSEAGEASDCVASASPR